jgi:hypothetical protein
LEITEQPKNRTVPPGGSATFMVSYRGAARSSYQWFHEGVPVHGATGPTLTFAPAQWTDAGVYHVVLVSACGTVASEVARLTVVEPPVISAIANTGPTGFQFKVSAQPGLYYCVERSTNLTSWSVLTYTEPTNTPWLFTDPAAPQPGPAFYRVRVEGQ